MSILDIIAHSLNEHHTRAQREGRALEANFVALIKEIVMSTVQDLQGRINTQSDKISQLEADVLDLVGRAGGTAPAADSSGIRLNQDQLDSMVNAIDSNNSRLDALKDHVVTGQGKGAESSGAANLGLPQTPSTSTSDTPVIPSPKQSDLPTNMNLETNSNNESAGGGVQSAPIKDVGSPPEAPAPIVPGPGPSAAGGVTSGNADTPQSGPPVTPPNDA